MPSDIQTPSDSPVRVQPVVIREPACITEYLDRIQRDNDAVIKRLMDTPLSMTGDSEPKLYDIAHKIRTLIADAKTVWR
jgi:hypothetical protein